MNTQTRTLKRSPTRVRKFIQFHRITGLIIALPVLLLVITGIPLQLTDTLKLGRIPITTGWILDAYSITAPDEALVSEDIQYLGDVLLTPGRVLPLDNPPVGIVHRDILTVVATPSDLILIPTDAEVPVETITPPAGVEQLGTNADGDLLIVTQDGILQSADFGATWLSPDPFTDSFHWYGMERVAATPVWQDRYRASKLSWERWLQDLHSGRFFGPAGEWLMSLASIALILLAITGMFVWLRRRPS